MAKIAFVFVLSVLLIALSIRSVLGEETEMQNAMHKANEAASTAKDKAESFKNSAGHAFKDAKEHTKSWKDWFLGKFGMKKENKEEKKPPAGPPKAA